jgi:hypothetical protein
MATALAVAAPQETPVGLAERLLAALRQSSEDRAVDLVEALRSRLAKRQPRDPRSLFDLDDRLIDLMDRAEEANETTGAVHEELIQEINDYIEAWRGKVDRIAGYWRWQESIAAVCGTRSKRQTKQHRIGNSLGYCPKGPRHFRNGPHEDHGPTSSSAKLGSSPKSVTGVEAL